jgi:hypothetical protein
MHGTATRIAIPLLLLASCAVVGIWGGDALPTWVANLSVKTGLGPDRAVRILFALQLAGAVAAAAWPALTRPVAWAVGGAFAFSGLAELSAIVNAPGAATVPPSRWAAPLAGLAVGATILAVLSRRPAPAPRRRVTAWTVLGLVAVLAASFATAARLSFDARSSAGLGADGVPTVVLNPDEWVGRTAAAAGIARHLPQLTPLTMEGTKWVVFYSPECGRCHQVFKAYFAGPQGADVVAVRIPRAPGETHLESDQPSDVECEGCERLSLPEGTRWVLTSPTIVRFRDGAVDCATSADYSRCRRGSEEAP